MFRQMGRFQDVRAAAGADFDKVAAKDSRDGASVHGRDQVAPRQVARVAPGTRQSWHHRRLAKREPEGFCSASSLCVMAFSKAVKENEGPYHASRSIMVYLYAHHRPSTCGGEFRK